MPWRKRGDGTRRASSSDILPSGTAWAKDLKAADGSRHLFSGSAEDMAGDIEFFREMGGGLLFFRFFSPTLGETLDRMERHAADLLPLVRDQ